jgi:hypothetical protein
MTDSLGIGNRRQEEELTEEENELELDWIMLLTGSANSDRQIHSLFVMDRTE